MATSSKQDALTDHIRSDVLSGELPPGTRLVEADLAAKYDHPRAAVHAALVILAAEGLIERRPHRGASVRALTVTEGIEIAEVRQELEALCARHAALKASVAERGELFGIAEAMRLATEEGLTQDYRALSARFHQRIAAIGGQATARRVLREIRNHRLDMHFPDAFGGGTSSHSLEQHLAIAQAIGAGDGALAEHLMYAHVGHVVTLLKEHAASAASEAQQRRIQQEC